MMDERPTLDYTVVRTVVLVLAGLGVVMVLSSSMATSFAASSSVWAQAVKQMAMVGAGLIAFWAALQLPPEKVKRASTILMVIAVVLLLAVLIPGIGTGKEEVGSQSWIAVGPLSFQPSELARVTIAVWGAKVLSSHETGVPFLRRQGLILYCAVAALCLGLIAMQGDLGMAVTFGVIAGLTLFFIGLPWPAIGALVALVLVALVTVFLSGGYRSNRFHVYFDALFGTFEDTRDIAFQSHQGFLSLGDGSLFGVGLGQSRAKWFYLPEARNDFIFAVIGEELGLWGGVLVVILFALLGYFGLRAAVRAQDQFQTLMAASLAAGIVSQAFVNIGYVVGIFPVTGIQLPMVSAGGTSAIITLGSMGLLASVARHEPGAISAMQNYGRPAFDRILGIREPKAPAQAAQRAGAKRSRSRDDQLRERFGTPITARASQRDGAPASRRSPVPPTSAAVAQTRRPAQLDRPSRYAPLESRRGTPEAGRSPRRPAPVRHDARRAG
nr:putative peptidoglycan glycosyltransferase FtsW [Corynebacterium capitovis]